MGELISVIVPVYNGEKYLKTAIESLVNQTYSNLEIILVNDGSSDKSLEICEKYAKKDERIVVLSKKNGGQYTARNLGLDYAKGNYIGFLDQDDYLDLTFYEKLYNIIKQYNACIARSNNYFLIDGKFVLREKRQEKTIYYNKDVFKEKLLSDEIWSHVTDRLFKKSAIENIRFPKSKTIEDMGFMRQLIEKSDVDEIYIQEPLFIYNNRADNTSHLFAKNHINSYERAIEFQKRYYFAQKNNLDNTLEILKQATFFSCSALFKMRWNISLRQEREILKKFICVNHYKISLIKNNSLNVKTFLYIYKFF